MTPRIYLAPMRGITDAVFRNQFQRFFGGVDVAICPFISAPRNQRVKPAHVKDMLPENNAAMPLTPQILTRHADDFIRLADYLFDLGYAVVNWNLGCPYPMVARKGKGSGMLPHTAAIDAFLDRVLTGMQSRLSIKLRLGRETRADIFRLIPVLNQYPLEEIILHPRTGIQMYTGFADADAFGECRQLLDHQMVYNGDIACVADFQRLQERFPGLDRWMLGRGLVADPFLAQAIKCSHAPLPERLTVMRHFHDALLDAYAAQLCGPGHLLGKMKSFWSYWQLAMAADMPRAVKRIQRSQTLASYQQQVAFFFNAKTGRAI